ncbi:MAG: NAD-dependent epimerase/dehydratase family protein [Gallionellaceae bacterium]|jgi:nucleoside-diphosphate-sugar epimerase
MKKILIIGCGDIANRVIGLLHGRFQLFGLVRNPIRRAELRKQGVIPLDGDLDDRNSLERIAGIADTVLHFAPPANLGEQDPRTRNLLAALSQGQFPRQIIYISTSGVYGDCAGDRVSETCPANPQSARARRRIAAETLIRHWAARNRVKASILRVPGIYAAGRLPRERILAGMPAISADQDSYTNHIHADDLARCVVAAMRLGKPNRLYHASDDSEMKMGEYFDVVADKFHLPRVPRMLRQEVECTVSPLMWSFMNESRRLTNRRMKQELKVKLRYPTVQDALTSMDVDQAAST